MTGSRGSVRRSQRAPASSWRTDLSPIIAALNELQALTRSDRLSFYAGDADQRLQLYGAIGWTPSADAIAYVRSPKWPDPSGEPFTSVDLEEHLPELRDFSRPNSVLEVPIRSGGRVVGVVRGVRHKPFAYAEGLEVQQLEGWLYALLRSLKLQAELAFSISKIAECDDELTLFNMTLLRACELLDADPVRSGIYVFDRTRDRFTLRGCAEHSSAALECDRKDPGPTAKVLREGKALWSNDVAADRARPGPWKDLLDDGPTDITTRAFIGIPLFMRKDRQVDGALILKSGAPRAWAAFEIQLVDQLAKALIEWIRRTRDGAGLLSAVVTASDKPIVAVNRDGIVTQVNDAAAQVINQGRGELLNEKVADTFYGGCKLLARHAMLALQARQTAPLRDHYTYLTRRCSDGLTIPIPVRLGAQELVATGGEIIGSVGIFEPLLGRLPERVRVFGDDEQFSFSCDPEMLRVIDAAADSRDRSALLVGERRSGKELLTRHLRNPRLTTGPRTKEPYERVICGGLEADDLAEELFGCVEGWKGRKRRHPGKIERADGGVLVLDELSEVPLFLQRRLLRVLEDHKVAPMGSDEGSDVDIRMIAVTSCSRDEFIDGSKFLPDLLNHLDAGSALFVPPFRDRRADILLAAVGYLEYDHGLREPSPTGFESEAIEMLWQYSWPGGLREMFALLRAACERWRAENKGCKSRDLRRELIGSDHLWMQLVHDASAAPYAASGIAPLTQDELRQRADRRGKQKSDRLREVDEAARGRKLFFEVWNSRPDLRRAWLAERHGAQVAIARVMAERAELAGRSHSVDACENLVSEILNSSADWRDA